MKTITKIAVLLLAILMLVPCLAACGNSTGTDTTTDNNLQNGTPPEDTTPKDPDYIEPVDMRNPDGTDYVYNAYVRSKAVPNGSFYCEDFWVAETSEDALSFAVYSRNQTIQENFHCRIVQTDAENADMYAELKNFYSNAQKYDLAIILANHAATAATSNLLKDINSLSYVDLTHDSYDQNSIKDLSMGGKLYYLSGDMNISTMDNTASTIVNLGLYRDYAEQIVETFGDEIYSNPYDIVTEKLWTMDTMLTIAELANVDVNKADGALNPTVGDTVGYYHYMYAPTYYFYSTGARITKTDEDGYPEFSIDDEYAQEVYDYLYKNFNTTLNSWLPAQYGGTRMPYIKTGKVLFVDFILWDVRKQYYPGEYYEYGILPTPMYEEGQGRYYSNVYFASGGTAHLWAMPQMCNNEENASRLFHVMAVYSGMEDSTMDAYYQKTMYMTVASDKGSRECMDTIRTSMVYDIALLYNWGGFFNLIDSIDTATSNQYQSKLDNLDIAEEEMNLTLEKFKNPQYVPDKD
ncbi:MAG: hypothetical protein IJW50_00105 [Clostridia bacterium]|nr:hypothetical protein [Clostridia bacterium]